MQMLEKPERVITRKNQRWEKCVQVDVEWGREETIGFIWLRKFSDRH
jgi:hypothetical protein